MGVLVGDAIGTALYVTTGLGLDETTGAGA